MKISFNLSHLPKKEGEEVNSQTKVLQKWLLYWFFFFLIILLIWSNLSLVPTLGVTKNYMSPRKPGSLLLPHKRGGRYAIK